MPSTDSAGAFASMTSVDKVAIAEPDIAGAALASKFSTGMLGPIAVGVALLSALVTFAVLTGLTPILPTNDVVLTVLAVNVVTVLILLVVILFDVSKIVQARRRGTAGARLHVRIVGLLDRKSVV